MEPPSALKVSTESRKDRLTAKLLDILVPLSGCERAQISTYAKFLEQGFDSLSLMQVVFAIRKEFSVKISFSQLMNQFPNVEMVAEHLDTVIPADQFATPGSRPTSTAPEPEQTTKTAPPGAVQQQISGGNNPPEGVTDQHQFPAPVAVRTRTRAPSALCAPPRTPTFGEAKHSGVNEILRNWDQSRTDSTAGVEKPAGVVSTLTTASQRGIFFSSQLSEHLSASYNESMTLRLKGGISVANLKRSLERLVERHDGLRAFFDETGSVMRIAPEMPLDVAVTDLSRCRSESERQEALKELVAKETARPFTLPGGPLFRSQIVVLGADSAAVIFTGHHIICDGWSLDVLTHDLCAFYSKELSGTPSGLGPAPSFASYVSEVARREHSAEFAEAKEYWEQKFAGGFPALALPADFPRGTGRDYHARRLDRFISAPLVNKLRALGAKQGCSFFAVVLGALAILLARVSRQRRFVLALPTAEQPKLGEPQLVGHCVSLIPFVVDIKEKESVSAYLVRIQSELGAAHDQSSFTLISLLENLRAASLGQNIAPISAGLTSVKKFRPHELPQRGFAVDYDANPKSYESFEFYLNAIEKDECLELHCHYDIGLLKNATVEGWLAAFEGILIEMAADDGRETNAGPVTELALSEVAAGEQEAAVLSALLKLWQRVLGHRAVGADDNLFALGGHSMTAAQLFASIERELGITAPLSALYDAPTPRKLAKVMANGNIEKQWQSLVPINRAGNRPPLFLFHGAKGNVLLYRSLAFHLGEDQPVYGLQSAGLDGRSPVDGDFERVARRYVKEIRRVQPEGPYMLGGYCLGPSVPAGTGVSSDRTVVLGTAGSARNYPDTLRRVRFVDPEQARSLIFLTNNFELPALTIAPLYKSRWRIELFFQWIKQHLRIKAFYGVGENAVKTQLWIAVASYVLIAILKKRLLLSASLHEILQVLSLTLFEKTPILQACGESESHEKSGSFSNQLSLLDL
jgi:acyl carrier protein